MVSNQLTFEVDVETSEDFDQMIDDIEDAANNMDRINDRRPYPCPECDRCPHCGRKRPRIIPFDSHYY